MPKKSKKQSGNYKVLLGIFGISLLISALLVGVSAVRQGQYSQLESQARYSDRSRTAQPRGDIDFSELEARANRVKYDASQIESMKNLLNNPKVDFDLNP